MLFRSLHLLLPLSTSPSPPPLLLPLSSSPSPPPGQNFSLRQLGICEPATRRGLAFCAEMGLPHRGYSAGTASDLDTENEAVMSPERAMRLWGRGVKGGRSSCLSSRSNSALTLTDTEHENKSDSDNGQSVCLSVCLDVSLSHASLSLSLALSSSLSRSFSLSLPLQIGRASCRERVSSPV